MFPVQVPVATLTPFTLSCFCVFVFSDIVPVGIIAGGTVGSFILLLMLLLALGFFLYRQRKGSECAQCVGPRTLTLFVSVSLSFIRALSLHLPLCLSTKNGAYTRHIGLYSNEINEYSENEENDADLKVRD